MEKENILIIAKQAFESYPQEDVIYITDDGNVFLNGNRREGEVHARLNGLEMHSIKKSEAKNFNPEKAPDKKTVLELPTTASDRKTKMAWLHSQNVKVAKNIPEAKLNEMLVDALKALPPAKEETDSEKTPEEIEREGIIALLTEKQIEFSEELSTEELKALLEA